MRRSFCVLSVPCIKSADNVIMVQRRIYLDNAATSWPKPPSVAEAVEHYLRENGAAAGRGVYREAVKADQVVKATRAPLGKLINAPILEPCIIHTFNGTDALNLAIQGAIRSGQRVLTTEAEHNSVLRPLRYLQESRDVRVTYAQCNAEGCLDAEDCLAKLPDQDWLVITHSSNVTGAVLPLEDIIPQAKRLDVKVIVDAAQTIGCQQIDVQALGIDLLAASGHKGLLGPLGTGFLYLAPHIAPFVTPLRFGGTGTFSSNEEQPAALPERFESGNLNVPGIVGLWEGVRYVLERGRSSIAEHEATLRSQLQVGLSEIPGVRMYAAPNAALHTPVLSFTLENFDPQEAATVLYSSFGIQVRAGLHCAPRMHQALGTAPGGTIRASWGPFTTPDEIDQLILAVREMATA
jgi:cysteine desulfurase / selenocysteine lyase